MTTTPTFAPTERVGFCNSCRTPVSKAAHRRHLMVMEAIYYVGNDARVNSNHWDNEPVEGEDLFVHCRGNPDEFDMDGYVIVCDEHFVEEVYNDWAMAVLPERVKKEAPY